jgi:hypothetical protein
MPHQAQGLTAAFKRLAGRNAVTMQGLWRLAAWGATAACALLIAVMTTRGEVASRRVAIALSSLSGSAAPSPRPEQATAQSPRPFDAVAETQRLSDAVRGLAAESDELKSRVAVVEHSMDDVTGSITRQAASVRAAPSGVILPPWPDNEPPLPPTTAAIANVLAPVVPMPQQYGVDVGSALSIPTLRARWAGIRSAHPDLFDGMRPVVTLKQVARSNRIELRLVVGPLASAEAAAQLCAYLMPYRLFCEPALFAGQHLALE